MKRKDILAFRAKLEKALHLCDAAMLHRYSKGIPWKDLNVICYDLGALIRKTDKLLNGR